MVVPAQLEMMTGQESEGGVMQPVMLIVAKAGMEVD